MSPDQLEQLIRRIVRAEVSQLLRPSKPSPLDDWSHEGPEDPEGDAELLQEALVVIRQREQNPRTSVGWEELEAELRQFRGVNQMDDRNTAEFRATAGTIQGFGRTPQEALAALMQRSSGTASAPIVIWPYNRGDAFFTEEQQERLQELKQHQETLTADEREELEELIAAAFEATVARTQALPIAKT